LRRRPLLLLRRRACSACGRAHDRQAVAARGIRCGRESGREADRSGQARGGDKPPEKAAERKPEGDKPADAKPADEKPADAKPAEAKPEEKAADAAKPAEAAKPAVDAPKPEPIKFEFELPAVLQANDEKIGTFNTLLNEAGLSAELGKKVGQDLLNLHAEGMQAYADHVAKEQHRVFNDTRDGWKKDVMADEQLGGSGYQTTMGAIARVRDLAVGEKDRPAFEQFLRITGAGDHPAFLRMMHNLSRVLDEPQASEIPNDPKPIPAVQGKGARRSIIYDHPRSRPGGRQ
jgi:hypothetical protein